MCTKRNICNWLNWIQKETQTEKNDEEEREKKYPKTAMSSTNKNKTKPHMQTHEMLWVRRLTSSLVEIRCIIMPK